MSINTVDRTYVESHAGVYFLLYSVPQMIATNTGMTRPSGAGTRIFHQSILCSDGRGTVETITAGPRDGRAWYRQVGFTPITVQIAYLAHPDPARVSGNFDTTAWRNPEIRQTYFRSNWQPADFELAKKLVRLHRTRIGSVGYNLGGHNSNSLVTFVWNRLSRNPASSGRKGLDNPREVWTGYFRPGASFDVFETSPAFYLNVLLNWTRIAWVGALALVSVGVQALRRRPANHRET